MRPAAWVLFVCRKKIKRVVKRIRVNNFALRRPCVPASQSKAVVGVLGDRGSGGLDSIFLRDNLAIMQLDQCFGFVHYHLVVGGKDESYA